MGVVYIISIVGPFLLIIGIATLVNRLKFLKESKVISGVVIDIKTDYINRKRSYFPIVKYFDEMASEKKVFESNVGYGSSKYKKGDNVELRYYSDGQKRKLCLNTWFGIWGFSFVLFLVGSAFSIFGFAALLLGVKQ